MINGYLMTVLIVAVPTCFAVFAPRRTALIARASFWLGIAINELPLYPMLWLAAATALAALDGALVSAGGLFALLIAVPTMVGLVLLLARGLFARQALAAAFRQANIDAEAQLLLEKRSLRRTLLSALAPFAVTVRGVRRIKDIPYGEHGRRNLLDVYRSTGHRQARPVLVYFHGGGYFSGRKNREARLLLYRLAARGWLCISANYRLRPAADFAGHLADLGQVLAWTREHAPEHGGDPTRIVLAGSSAGAHMASIAALAPDLPELRAGSAGRASRIAAVVCFYGYYGHYYGLGPQHTPSSSPVDHVRSDAPAFFIAHGNHDTHIPVTGARYFAEKLRAASSNPVVYAELPGAQHAFDLYRSPRFESVVDAVGAFLDQSVDGLPTDRHTMNRSRLLPPASQ